MAGPYDLSLLLTLLSMAVQCAILVGIWRLRRWALIAFAVFAVLSLGYAQVMVGLNPKVSIAWLVIRGMVLVPALIWWKRFT